MKFSRCLQVILLFLLLSAGLTVSVTAESRGKIAQTAAGQKKVTLSWERSGEAVSYEIFYRYAVHKKYHLLKRVETSAARPSVSVNLPKAGRKYGIKIVPYNGEGEKRDAYLLADCVTLPGKISLRSQKSYATSRTMKIYWKDVESAQGYEFLAESLSKDTVKRYRSGKKTSTVLTDILPGRFYKLRIRGYTRVNGKNVYGTASYTYIAQQPRVKFKWGSHSVSLASWPAVEGAADYTVYLTDHPASGYRKVKTTQETQAAITGLSKNRKYYVYVTANMRRGKKVYASPRTKRYTFRLQTE
ncbi:MAG: fibronectin type III domain-containing protein [Lachnospiraceae bacterium]|nr:fibronectin type III domain-containing protein [Lachnospiraceae bacterium]